MLILFILHIERLLYKIWNYTVKERKDMIVKFIWQQENCVKKVRRKLYTFYCYMCTILISCVKKVEKIKWLLGFFSNCNVFNYGTFQINFFF